ncbi:MAG: glycoside hydrolase family 15 protein [Bacteroidales bacterium]|nr:glycoside hydrolase family 15 protein [Bacteroidales bacterium]
MNNLNYGVVGNCRSAALISDRGSIDWLCLPNFSSASVFAKILDNKKGGEFVIEADENYSIKQRYIENTNILLTLFDDGNNTFELIDFMPRFITEQGDYFNPPDMIRYIKILKGSPVIRVIYNPRLNYAQYDTVSEIGEEFIKSYTSEGIYDSVYLYSNLDFKQILDGNEIALERDAYFLLSYNQKIEDMQLNKIYLKLQRTKVYWYNWIEKNIRFNKFNPEIIRSALVLKLLTYQVSGSILAAVTTSIPETIGGERNWDYRYCWIRDASMVIKVLMTLGHTTGARRFLNYIVDLIPFKDEKIQIMYGIKGEKILTESTLDHLEGYEGSKPIRIGNSRYELRQNDIYGVLMDVIYQNFLLYVKSQEVSEELWTLVRSIAKTVITNWKNTDISIWENKREEMHYVFSKVLCWLAMDRGMKIALKLGKINYEEEWRFVRDEIKEDILSKGWSEELQAFKQSYESDEMDASILLMETYGFIEAGDPKYVSTVKAIKKHLLTNGLMARYRQPDDYGQPASSYNVCTFWLIRSLYKIGEQEEAEQLFKEVLSYSNHLGLFSENIDISSKRLLGNFPHGSTHLALIEAAMTIAKGGRWENFE